MFLIFVQVCRFCWHRIRTDENGLCPHCREVREGGRGGECGEGNEQRGVTERLNMEAFVFFSLALRREPSRIHPSDTGSVRDIISVYLHCVGLL